LIKQKFPAKISTEAILFIALLLLNLFFVIFRFFPTIRDINLWDDAAYINRGRTLLQGTLPKFSDNPLMALIFALSYLPFQTDGFWMMHTATVGRILMFALMWLGVYLIAKQLPGLKWYVMVSVMFVSGVMVDILENPSDTFYAALAGLAFWQMLCYLNTRRVKHLALTSLIIALAALARNDGLVLFGVFLMISLAYLRSAENKLQHLAAAILPFLILVGGYVLTYGLITGDYDLGTQERSYLAFQQGQMALTVPDKDCKLGPVKCVEEEVNRLYGTSSENGNSVFRAIAHNPQAYLQRLTKTLSGLPRLAHDAFGKQTFYALLFLTVLGIFALIRKKKFALLLVSLAWCVPLASYFLTFFRAGYLRTPFFIFFALAAFGVFELIESLGQKRQWIWAAALLALTGVGMMQSLNYFYFSTVILLACMLLGYFIKTGSFESPYKAELILLVFLAGGLVMRGGFTPPVISKLGAIPEEQAILTLEKRLPENALVGAGAPGIPWAARMDFVPTTEKNYLVTANSPQEYYDGLKKLGIKAIYVDNIITNNAPLWALIKPGIGKYYDRVYAGRAGSILVLVVK
jgi:hypothetical protein